jgi:hypothetical protein
MPEIGRVVSPPDFTIAVVLYGILGLGGFLGLWLYYDRRDRSIYDVDRRKITFHCIRCDQLYTDKPGTETCPCPQCGHLNARLKF